MTPFDAVLEGLTRVPGVRSALLVSAEDGLAVAEASRPDVEAAALAALAASLAARVAGTVGAAGMRSLRSLHLETSRGGMMVVPAGAELLLVTVADEGTNVGLLRLAMRHAAEKVD